MTNDLISREAALRNAWMLNVTIDSLLESTASTRDLVYDLAGQFGEAVEALRTVRGNDAAEAFLLLIRNMDEAGAFSVEGVRRG